MRNLILLTMSGVALTAVTALAQETNSCQAEENTVQQAKVLLKDKTMPPDQVVAAQEAYARCQRLQTQLAALKAQANDYQAKLDELRKKYMESYPDIKYLKAKLDELRAQELNLTLELGRTAETSASLKQSSGGLLTGLPDRWWKTPATAQSLGLTTDQQKKMDDVFQQYRL